MGEYQTSFLKERPVTDQIYILKEIPERSHEFQKVKFSKNSSNKEEKRNKLADKETVQI